MEDDLAYFTQFCSLVDFHLMKTIDDDTVSDPKPRLKKHPKIDSPRRDIHPEPESEEKPVTKEFKLEKAKKPREKYQKIRDAIAPPASEKHSETKKFDFKRKKFSDRSDQSETRKDFRDNPRGSGTFEKRKDFGDKARGSGKFEKRKDFRDKPRGSGKFEQRKDTRGKSRDTGKFASRKSSSPKKFKPEWRG